MIFNQIPVTWRVSAGVHMLQIFYEVLDPYKIIIIIREAFKHGLFSFFVTLESISISHWKENKLNWPIFLPFPVLYQNWLWYTADIFASKDD